MKEPDAEVKAQTSAVEFVVMQWWLVQSRNDK
jgi:hypothetical protein